MKTSRSSRIQRLVLASLLLATTAVVGAVVSRADSTSSPQEAFDELLKPEPLWKTFTISVAFSSGSSPQLVSATLARGPARALTAAGPEALLAEVRDDQGELLKEFWAPNPLILRVQHDDAGPGIVRSSQETGRFVFGFAREAKTFTLQSNGTIVLSVDLEPVIDAFCTAHPNDTDCVARNDITLPSLSWISPVPNEPLSSILGNPPADLTVITTPDGDYELNVAADDNIGIPKVTFMAGGVTICELEAPPYKCIWNVKAGVYDLSVTARDSAGNSRTFSQKVAVVAPPEL
jgi:hypothetical protein